MSLDRSAWDERKYSQVPFLEFAEILYNQPVMVSTDAGDLVNFDFVPLDF